MNKLDIIFSEIEQRYGNDISKTYHIESDRLELSRKNYEADLNLIIPLTHFDVRTILKHIYEWVITNEREMLIREIQVVYGELNIERGISNEIIILSKPLYDKKLLLNLMTYLDNGKLSGYSFMRIDNVINEWVRENEYIVKRHDTIVELNIERIREYLGNDYGVSYKIFHDQNAVMVGATNIINDKFRLYTVNFKYQDMIKIGYGAFIIEQMDLGNIIFSEKECKHNE